MGTSAAIPGRRAARRAANSSAMELAARWGHVARGLLYLLIGLLALQLAFDGGGEQADNGGALRELAERPFGGAVIWGVGVGLACMAVWRLSEAAFGASGPDGHRASRRGLSGARSVFYAVSAFSVLSFAAGAGSGGSTDEQSRDATAEALGLPLGRWLVGGVGLAVLAAGVWIAGRALLRTYHEHLALGRMSRATRRAVDVLGVAGGVARGALFAGLGVFAARAAWDFDPDEAKGMDDTLRSFAETPAGPWLLVAIAVGLVLFGLFSLAMARWRRV
ncbi:DUF1206 domain-containing protein [Streptomyces sp. 3MP-14]|uniref:DUF1206 domain-containing protein n=1 Tax=Streptomyces mimosae TaxID=2586635 RepID=A0A5N6AL63_9ACTN|nr:MULTISPECIES: DUF1206 domain-containing protein [Streptomyces]KAB8168806.1 DUF1206 domain-containing protein [Streptomyces mimosae]KAB8177914.1 DUF1206 domain-containing protein [Streptomyces sp. 3MP-14]